MVLIRQLLLLIREENEPICGESCRVVSEASKLPETVALVAMFVTTLNKCKYLIHDTRKLAIPLFLVGV